VKVYSSLSARAGDKCPGTGIPDKSSLKPEVIAMRGNDVYLEAPSRTQELLNMKWTLKSAGFRVASTWHETQESTSSLLSKDHWDAKGVEQLYACHSLVVIRGKDDKAVPEMAMIAGLALARGLQVVWIGPPVAALNAFRAVSQFNTAEDYQKQILQQMHFQSASAAERLAA
jgi:hypothetical protein